MRETQDRKPVEEAPWPQPGSNVVPLRRPEKPKEQRDEPEPPPPPPAA